MSFCVHCGNKHQENSKFCTKCGKPVLAVLESENKKSLNIHKSDSRNETNLLERSFNTRIGVGDFWIGHFCTTIIFLLLIAISDYSVEWFIYLITILYFYYEISLSVRRAHDINHSGWMILLLLIPALNLLYGLMLSFTASKAKNKYGSIINSENETFGNRLLRIFALS